jgi:hypothetical protein
MRKFIMAVAVVAMLSFSAVAMAAAPVTGSTTCTDGSLQGRTISTNLTVPAGAACDLSGAKIAGNVAVYGFLFTHDATTYGNNVTVYSGGHFKAFGSGMVKINGNLSFVNPEVGSDNGFWAPSEVTGNLSYTITSDTVYPLYNAPYLYSGGGLQVDRNFNYTDLGTGFHSHLDQTGLTVLGSKNISL